LQELRNIQDPELVQEKLCEFHGVGRKVADCVALFSLQQDDAIPVDVHVWNIARRDYDADGMLQQIKSLTPTTYKQVGDVFQARFANKAGWAHSLLFVAELPSFRPVLPKELIQEMDRFKQEEQLRKQQAKADKKKKES
jgi:N-glycosylase/DNA lyase